MKGDFRIDEDGDKVYENWDDLGDMLKGTEEYCCPECKQVLFKTEDEAIEFLR